MSYQILVLYTMPILCHVKQAQLCDRQRINCVHNEQENMHLTRCSVNQSINHATLEWPT